MLGPSHWATSAKPEEKNVCSCFCWFWLCDGAPPVHFWGLSMSRRPYVPVCVNSLSLCKMQLNVLNDLVKATGRGTEKKECCLGRGQSPSTIEHQCCVSPQLLQEAVYWRPLLPTRCWLVWCWCVSTLEQRSWRRCMGGLKTGPSRRHRIQPAEGPFLDPRAQETFFKKGLESGPAWNQKRSPLEGPVLVPFWPLHCGKSVEAFISSGSWFDQLLLRLESWTGEAHFCTPAFSYVLKSKKGPLLCHINIVLLQFP